MFQYIYLHHDVVIRYLDRKIARAVTDSDGKVAREAPQIHVSQVPIYSCTYLFISIYLSIYLPTNLPTYFSIHIYICICYAGVLCVYVFVRIFLCPYRCTFYYFNMNQSDSFSVHRPCSSRWLILLVVKEPFAQTLAERVRKKLVISINR